MARTIKTLLVGGDDATRGALRESLSGDSTIEVIAASGESSSTTSAIREGRPDLVILLAQAGSESALEICREIDGMDLDVGLLVITDVEGDPTPLRFFEHGARACLPDSVEPIHLRGAVREVASGGLIFPAGIAGEVRARVVGPLRESILTGRENQVLGQMGRGLRNREIARELGISQKTVETHVRHVLLKLGASSRTQAVVQAMKSGWF